MNKKLHILFINSWYPSRVLPTNGDFIQRHAEAVALDNKVTAIHIVSDKNCDKLEITDKTINGVRTLIGYVRRTKNPLLKYVRFLRAFRKMNKMLDDFNMVQVNRIYPLGIFALYLKYLKRKPYIISEHWTGFLKNSVISMSFIEKIVSKIIVKNASFTCPVSENLADSMRQLGLKGNYRIIPNVVNTNLFKPDKIKNDQFTILHISNMSDEHKNISGLLRVIAKLKKEISNFKLILIGSDSNSYANQLEKLGLQDTVELFPQLEHTEVVPFMQEADVFVLFSNYENLPCVILESFSCGLPVISTNVGGISEFFPNDFGFLIPTNNSKQLIELLVHFYRNVPHYDSLKMHQYVKDHFSQPVISKAFLNCYLRAMN